MKYTRGSVLGVKQGLSVIPATLVFGFVILFTASCSSTDVVLRYALDSFSAISSKLLFTPAKNSMPMRIEARDGAYIEIAKDFSSGTDVKLSFNAQPFLDAGLNPNLLSNVGGGRWSVEEGRLYASIEISQKGVMVNNDDATAYISLIAKQDRTRLAYHSAGRHYGIFLAPEVSFEWASNWEQNDKDLVFVLDPGFLRSVGVDPSKVLGWSLALIPMEEKDGTMTETEKLVHAYDF